jgi:hypothetical protein
MTFIEKIKKHSGFFTYLEMKQSINLKEFREKTRQMLKDGDMVAVRHRDLSSFLNSALNRNVAPTDIEKKPETVVYIHKSIVELFILTDKPKNFLDLKDYEKQCQKCWDSIVYHYGDYRRQTTIDGLLCSIFSVNPLKK